MNRKLAAFIPLFAIALAAVWLAKAGATPTVTFEIDPPNPVAGQMVSLRDTSAAGGASWLWDFGDGGSATQAAPSHAWSASGAYDVRLTTQGTTVAQSLTVSDPSTLRLLGVHPFEISIQVKDPNTGAASAAQAVDVTDRFGWFSFPSLTNDPGNPEVTVKVLEAPTFGHYWIFWSAMTSLHYTMTVRDVSTNQVEVYEKNDDSPCGSWDLKSFPYAPSPTPAPPTETPVPGQPSHTRTPTRAATPTPTPTGSPATPTPTQTPSGPTTITLRSLSWGWSFCPPADQGFMPCTPGICSYTIEDTSTLGIPPNTFQCHNCVIHLHEGCTYNLNMYNADPPLGEPSSMHAISDNSAIGLPATPLNPGETASFVLNIPVGAPEQDFHCTNDSCAQGGPPETTHEKMLGKIIIDP